jgi:hypothetical protein
LPFEDIHRRIIVSKFAYRFLFVENSLEFLGCGEILEHLLILSMKLALNALMFPSLNLGLRFVSNPYIKINFF